MPQETITLEVFRYRPDEDKESTFQSYDVPYHEHWVVLDALNWIKDTVDGTLSYRWSCRMGVCGSCGMMINGDPVLTCAAFLKDYFPKAIRVEPLVNFPVERDLVIDMDGFMEKLKSVKPWIIRDDTDQTDEEYLQTPSQLAAYKEFSMCINCMLCYSACPELDGHPDRALAAELLPLGAGCNDVIPRRCGGSDRDCQRPARSMLTRPAAKSASGKTKDAD